MSSHLSNERLMDVLEHAASPSEREHARSCVACRARVEEAAEGLELARGAELPEPPQLYWEAFRRQVSRRLATEGGAWWWWWWRLGPALAAAAALIALATSHAPPGPEPGPGSQLLSVWSPLPEDDPGLSVLSAMVSSGAELVGVRARRGLAEDLLELSDEDSQALAEALREELKEDRS
jgi:hypothetical protein